MIGRKATNNSPNCTLVQQRLVLLFYRRLFLCRCYITVSLTHNCLVLRVYNKDFLHIFRGINGITRYQRYFWPVHFYIYTLNIDRLLTFIYIHNKLQLGLFSMVQS